MKKKNIVEIQEDVKISQNDKTIILEKGDKIKILNEEKNFSRITLALINRADEETLYKIKDQLEDMGFYAYSKHHGEYSQRWEQLEYKWELVMKRLGIETGFNTPGGTFKDATS